MSHSNSRPDLGETTVTTYTQPNGETWNLRHPVRPSTKETTVSQTHYTAVYGGYQFTATDAVYYIRDLKRVGVTRTSRGWLLMTTDETGLPLAPLGWFATRREATIAALQRDAEAIAARIDARAADEARRAQFDLDADEPTPEPWSNDPGTDDPSDMDDVEDDGGVAGTFDRWTQSGIEDVRDPDSGLMEPGTPVRWDGSDWVPTQPHVPTPSDATVRRWDVLLGRNSEIGWTFVQGEIEHPDAIGPGEARLADSPPVQRPVHTVRGAPIGPEGVPYGTTHDMDCPGCEGTSFLTSPRSETYWAS